MTNSDTSLATERETERKPMDDPSIEKDGTLVEHEAAHVSS